jgi:hypothetical protein
MKTPFLGSAIGLLVALLVGPAQARDDGRYSQSPLKPWFDSLKSGRDYVAPMLMVPLFQIRIGNRKTATTGFASTTNGSMFRMMP